MRPGLYLKPEKIGSLRSIHEVQEFIRSDTGKPIWERMLERLDWYRSFEPFTPRTPLPGRSSKFIEMAENDYTLSSHTGQRVMGGALAHLLTGEAKYRDDALRQLACVLDEDPWPEWRHGVNARKGLKVDHRVGNFILHFSIAYDWLHAFLSEDQRRWIVAGLDRRGIKPVFASMEVDSFWNTYSNWSGVLVNGIGLFGMAMGDEHPRSQELIDYATPWMQTYLSMIGPEGEFNESPAYAASIIHAIMYFNAVRYYEKGEASAFEESGLGPFGRWYAYHTLPPKRVVEFGDGGKDATPNAVIFGALADLMDDGVLQWFYLKYRDQCKYEFLPMELVSINPLIKPVNPDGRWPRGRAFSANAQSAISRSSWDPNAPSCVVCGKGAHGLEEMRARGYGGWYHLDLDAGQVIIDGYGERLVVDLGSAGGYGPGNLKRTDSYGKGTVGHNVVMVGRRNTLELGPTRPRITASDFDDAKGGWWKVDLTGIYEGARCVERTVVYLHPGIVAVVDEVELEQAEEVSLRWHTADRCEPDAEGRFTIEAEGVRCVCRVARLDGEAPSAMRREHSYEPPYDVDYFGIKRPQLHESYVEAVVEDVKLSYLSLFCVLRADEVAGPWIEQSGIWSIPLPGGAVEVSVREPSIDVRNTGTGMTWTVDR